MLIVDSSLAVVAFLDARWVMVVKGCVSLTEDVEW